MWPKISNYGGAPSFEDIDSMALHDQINAQSTRLFCQSEDMLVEAGTISTHGIETFEIESEKELEVYFEGRERNCDTTDDQECLKSEVGAASSARSEFFLLDPAYGWDTLPITHQAMMKLLSYLNVFARFFKYLTAFGMKTFAQDEGFGGFDSNISLNENAELSSLELCFLLKYVDMKESPLASSNPWSIRQALIYQKSMPETDQNSYIFVRQSELLGKQLNTILRKTEVGKPIPKSPHWTQVQTMCFRSVGENWRQYINWLDQEVSILFDKVILASVEPEKLEAWDSVSSSLRDMKRLQYLIDQATRTSHMLDINANVIEQMKSMALRTRALEGASKGPLYNDFITSLNNIGVEHKFLYKNALALVNRTQLLSNQLRDTVNFRNGEMNKKIGSLTSESTCAIVDLSHKSTKETRAMKILTVLALIFVPISFAATFMQMGYITVASGPGFSVTAAKSLWLFAILAIALTIVTFAIYFAFEFINKRLIRKKKGFIDQSCDESKV